MDGHLSGWIDANVKKEEKESILIVTFTENGEEWAGKLYDALSEEYRVLCCIHTDGSVNNMGRKSVLKETLPRENLREFRHTNEILREEYRSSSLIIFISSTGIAVRELAAYLRKEMLGPAVLVMDDMAIHVISLISGHIGGANSWCREIAALTGAEAVITTATDLHGKFAVDMFAKENDLRIEDPAMIKEVSKRVLRSQPIGIFSDFEVTGHLPKGFFLIEHGENRKKAYAMHPECGLVITYDPDTPKKFEVECRLFPNNIEFEEDGVTVAYTSENKPVLRF